MAPKEQRLNNSEAFATLSGERKDLSITVDVRKAVMLSTKLKCVLIDCIL